MFHSRHVNLSFRDFLPTYIEIEHSFQRSVPNIKASPTTDICQFAVPKITTKILVETKPNNECNPPPSLPNHSPCPEYDTMLWYISRNVKIFSYSKEKKKEGTEKER